MPNVTDHQFYIEHGREERYLEYKRAMTWVDDDTKLKIVKAMMAMVNLRNGGVIVVGMQEVRRGLWEPEMMTPQQVSSFIQDDIATYVNDYATPAIQFSVEPFVHNGNRFVVIQVQEFGISPVICRKPLTLRGRVELAQGNIYYRNSRKNESAPIASDEDMRELIGLAVDKGISKHVNRLNRLGLIPTETPNERDKRQYEAERAGL